MKYTVMYNEKSSHPFLADCASYFNTEKMTLDEIGHRFCRKELDKHADYSPLDPIPQRLIDEVVIPEMEPITKTFVFTGR